MNVLGCRRVGENQGGHGDQEEYDTAGSLDVEKARDRLDHAINRLGGQASVVCRSAVVIHLSCLVFHCCLTGIGTRPPLATFRAA
jgi:hypothetical protein